jgi:predicted dehydrogenase|tara:strand:+ start:991 stop:2019 length:1029 start_codon:yes stop_codon:yes gene_type:complete
MQKVNWGIIGLGRIAHKFALSFNEVSNANLLAVASKDHDRLNDFKKKFNLDTNYCYNNYEQILNNKYIDIIYIALPHKLHFEWIMKCIDYNKNVLTEKPATINIDEIKKINNKLNETKIFFAEGFMYRFHPQTLKLVDLIKQNEIGELQSMKSFFGKNIIEKKNIFGFKKLKINKESRLFREDLGGGSILDLGCYPASLSILIANLKSKLQNYDVKLTEIKKTIGPTKVDLEAYTKIEFINDFNSYIGSSFKKDLGKTTKILGSKGEILVPDSWHCENPKIILNGKEYFLENKFNNIFSYEIESISNSLLNDQLDPQFPAINRNETELNMVILNKWINSDEG